MMVDGRRHRVRSLPPPLQITYFPDGTTCGPLLNPSRVGDAKSFLGGKLPGDVADNDETNPVLWRRPEL